MSEPTPTPTPTADQNAQRLIDRVHPTLLAIGSVLAVCLVLGSFAVFVLSTASAQTTQQNEPFAVKQQIVIADLAEQKAGAAEFRSFVVRKLERQDEKQDLILDALRVPLWKRPASDGGP